MMALVVHLKTVAHLRGKGDRIAKVTFRGRTSLPETFKRMLKPVYVETKLSIPIKVGEALLDRWSPKTGCALRIQLSIHGNLTYIRQIKQTRRKVAAKKRIYTL